MIELHFNMPLFNTYDTEGHGHAYDDGGTETAGRLHIATVAANGASSMQACYSVPVYFYGQNKPVGWPCTVSCC